MKKRYWLYIALLCSSMSLFVWAMQTPESSATEQKEEQEEKFILFNEPKPLFFQAAKQILINWKDAISAEQIKQDWDKIPQDLKNAIRQLVNQPIDSAGRTILFYSDTPEDIDFFIKSLQADVNYRDFFGYTPLQFMTMMKPQNVQKLIELGAESNPPQSNLEMIHKYAIQGLIEPINKLLASGVQVDLQAPGTNVTPLMLAARSNQGPTVELLVKKGANVNATNHLGSTPLMPAIESGNIDIVEYLISKGANVNHSDNNQRTPLHFAVHLGNEPMVRLLLNKGAQIDAQDNNNQTPLMFAIRKHRSQIAKLLIDKGADLNIQDRHGNTALIIAADKGQNQIVQKLLSTGADPTIQNRERNTALSKTYANIIELTATILREKDKRRKKGYQDALKIYEHIQKLLEFAEKKQSRE